MPRNPVTDFGQMQSEAALVCADIKRVAGDAGTAYPAGGGGVVQALVEERPGFLASGGVIVELKPIETENSRGCGLALAEVKERLRAWCGKLLELADTRIGTLKNREGLVSGTQGRAESVDQGLPDVVLCGALGQQLHDDEVGIAVGYDAGEVIGLGKDQTLGIGVRIDRRNVPPASQSFGNALSEIGKVLGAIQAGNGGNHAQGELRGRRIQRGAERAAGNVFHRHEPARRQLRLRGRIGEQIGAIYPKVAGAKTVRGAAGNTSAVSAVSQGTISFRTAEPVWFRNGRADSRRLGQAWDVEVQNRSECLDDMVVVFALRQARKNDAANGEALGTATGKQNRETATVRCKIGFAQGMAAHQGFPFAFKLAPDGVGGTGEMVHGIALAADPVCLAGLRARSSAGKKQMPGYLDFDRAAGTAAKQRLA